MLIRLLVTTALVHVTACATQPVVDELAGEDGDGEAGKADGSGAFTYVTTRESDDSHGIIVTRLNRSTIDCAGELAAECRVDGFDFSAIEATEARRGRIDSQGRQPRQLMFRGEVVLDAEEIGRYLRITEVWETHGHGPFEGVFVLATVGESDCDGCGPLITERRLNSTRSADIDGIDYSPATDVWPDELDAAHAAELEGGVMLLGERIVDGDRTLRAANRFYLQLD